MHAIQTRKPGWDCAEYRVSLMAPTAVAEPPEGPESVLQKLAGVWMKVGTRSLSSVHHLLTGPELVVQRV